MVKVKVTDIQSGDCIIGVSRVNVPFVKIIGITHLICFAGKTKFSKVAVEIKYFFRKAAVRKRLSDGKENFPFTGTKVLVG